MPPRRMQTSAQPRTSAARTRRAAAIIRNPANHSCEKRQEEEQLDECRGARECMYESEHHRHGGRRPSAHPGAGPGEPNDRPSGIAAASRPRNASCPARRLAK
eukprot:11162024-Alexandrium_andersonii.AAC.1